MREKLHKRENGCKKSSRLAFMAMLIVIGLSGCGDKETVMGQKNAGIEQSVESESTSNKPTAEDTLDNSTVETAGSDAIQNNNGESGAGAIPLYPGTHRSSIIQEDEDYLYICGSCRVSQIDKATGVEQILWENPKEVREKEEYLYAYGSGLLLGDKLYFIERWYEDNWNIGRAFSCINTDGSGYEQLAKLSEIMYDSMYLANGTLTINDLGRELFYQVFEDGTLSAPDEIPVSNIEQLSYQQNGSRVLFRQECINEFGFVVYGDLDYNVSYENPDTGEQFWLPELEQLESYNDEYFLCYNFENGRELVLTEKSVIVEKYTTGQQEQPYIDGKTIFSDDAYYCVIGMDEEYVYIRRSLYAEVEGAQQPRSYERISLKTGEREVIFEVEPTNLYFESDLMDEVVLNDYIYYMEERDYIYYLMRRKTDGSGEAEVVLSEGVYNTGIGSVGAVESYRGSIYSEKNPERLLYEIDLSWLVVNDSFPGAKTINAVLTEEQDSNIARVEADAAGMEDGEIEYVLNTINYSYSSEFSGFSYYDSRYISFVQSGYEYYGGAHGMSVWEGYTFDLQTGEMLLLSDIIGNSEEELKEIVTGYFEEMINQEPEYFWEDAAGYIYEDVSYQSDFYLTEQGIVFFYHPYELAAYAAGFQEVTIPYSEFNMQISLEKAMN